MRSKAQLAPFLLCLGDMLIIPLSFILGHFFRFRDLQELSIKVPASSLAWMTLGYVLVFYFTNLYEPRKHMLSLGAFSELLLVVLVAAVLVSFINYGLFLKPIGRGIFIFANVCILVLAYIWRLFFSLILRFIVRPKRVVIVGAGRAGREMARVIRLYPEDLTLVGMLEMSEGRAAGISSDSGLEVLGSKDRLLEVCSEMGVDRVVVAASAEEDPRFGGLLLEARLKGLEVVEMADLYQNLEKKVPINFVSDKWFLKAKGFDWSERSLMVRVKRILDVVFSSLILTASLPLWPLIAFLVKVSSRGPVFYTQERVGRKEKIFLLYKFRSMIEKAEKGQPLWAQVNDKRVTIVGRVLRALHLDELPQLINVLKGDMSLVGPRPERPIFVEEFKTQIPYYSLRHFLKPGLTGWAQVNYPYAASLEDSIVKLEYDLYYVYHMTLLLDFRILVKTAQNLLRRK